MLRSLLILPGLALGAQALFGKDPRPLTTYDPPDKFPTDYFIPKNQDLPSANQVLCTVKPKDGCTFSIKFQGVDFHKQANNDFTFTKAKAQIWDRNCTEVWKQDPLVKGRIQVPRMGLPMDINDYEPAQYYSKTEMMSQGQIEFCYQDHCYYSRLAADAHKKGECPNALKYTDRWPNACNCVSGYDDARCAVGGDPGKTLCCGCDFWCSHEGSVTPFEMYKPKPNAKPKKSPRDLEDIEDEDEGEDETVESLEEEFQNEPQLEDDLEPQIGVTKVPTP